VTTDCSNDQSKIPDIAFDVLEIPDEPAIVGIERKRGIGIEPGVRRERCAGSGLEQRRGVVGVADTEIHEVELRVVAARCPHAATESLVGRCPIPGVAARLARTRNRVEAPRFATRGRIERHDETTAPNVDTQARTDDDLALGDQGTAVQMQGDTFGLTVRRAFRVREYLLVPDDLAALHVECDQVTVGGRGVEPVAEDGEALGAGTATVVELVRQ
jgi:hypothetical protein